MRKADLSYMLISTALMVSAPTTALFKGQLYVENPQDTTKNC